MPYSVDKTILSSPLLEQMPGWMFVKDLELKYTSTTIRSALLCGFKNQDAKYGRTDYELKCKASESAVFFQQQDKQVILEGREISFLQLNQYADEQTHVFITKKVPLKKPCGKIIGVCGMVEEISNQAIMKAIFQLVNVGTIDSSLNVNKKNFEIDGSTFFNALPEKESVIMFYFIRGFSIKEIGVLMNLSAYVVEAIFEELKNKFNCSSLKDLYNYCISHQAYNAIPLILLQRCIYKNIRFDAENSKITVKVTQRQKECINLLLTGATSLEIAQKLNVSPRTIESYIDLLKSKFHARNKTDLVIKLCRYYQ